MNELSARLGVPACMLLRANRIYSEAWLLPGREIAVPDLEFCLRDWGMCPRRALYITARRMSAGKDGGMHEERESEQNDSRLY